MMGGSAWLKATVGVLIVLGVGVGWNAWTKAPSSSDTQATLPNYLPSNAPTDTPTTAAASPRTPLTPGVAPLGQGVRVRGAQLIDSSGAVVRLFGVGMAETSCGPGHGPSAVPLDITEARAIASWHLNAVRIGLNEDCWLGINGVKPAYSGSYYQDNIISWVADLNEVGIVAILDLQFTAPGGDPAKAPWPMPDEDHSPAFWSQVATEFASVPGVIFDLFGEPYMGTVHPTQAQWSCWLKGCVNTTPVAATSSSPSNGQLVAYQTAGMQQLVNVVRATGAQQPIMLGGLFWSGDPCGYRESPAPGRCPEVAYLPSDPLHQLIIDFHTYLPNSACTDVSCWNVQAAGLSTADLPVVTGEFGEKDCSASYIDEYMDWADAHGISYLAWTWDVNSTEPCVANNDRSNHYLLQNWSGDPTTMAPDGVAFQSHVEAVYEAPLERAAHSRP
jgi:endoglucanase